MSIKNKHLEVGEIVYWISRNLFGNHGFVIEFGQVFECWHDGYDVDRLVSKNTTVIDGIPIHEYPWYVKHKLPKDWSYDKQMYVLTDSRTEEEIQLIKSVHINNIDGLKMLISKGEIIPAKQEVYWHGNIDTVVEKGEYYLRWEYNKYDNKACNVFLSFEDVYMTYDEAKDKIDEIVKENNRVASLSDHDYNIEKMNEVLDKGRYTPEEKEKIRKMLLSLNEFDDLEFRYSSSGMEFKKWKNKRWIGVNV